MNTKKDTYSTSQVAKIVGISIYVLRAWEKRYQVVGPTRFGEHRGYSHQEVDHLINLKKMVDSGIPIRKASQYSPEEILSILNLKQKEQDLETTKLVGYLQKQEWMSFHWELENLSESLRPERLIIDILIPLLSEIGHLVESKILNIGHEHYASAQIRELIIKIPGPAIKRKDLSITFSTPEGDYHELGILMAAKLASLQGFPVIYLGPHVPIETLAEVINQFSPRISVVAASSIRRNFHHFSDYLLRLCEKINCNNKKQTQLMIAGELSLHLSQKYQTIPSMAEWENILKNL